MSNELSEKWEALGLPWMAGMKVISPDGWARVDDDALDQWEGWPDWSDPATVGCLLQMVRDAYGCPTAIVEVRDDRARVVYPYGSDTWVSLTPWVVGGEAEALIAALEAAQEEGCFRIC